MKKKLYIFALLIIATRLNAQHQDHTLWYTSPAKVWDEALPIGNGRMGAMIYGDWNKETIQINEESLWAGSKTEADADAASKMPEIQKLLLDGDIAAAAELSEKYLKSDPLRIRSNQSFGQFNIEFATKNIPSNVISSYKRSLDLQTGIATVVYDYGGVQYKRETFMSAPDNAMVMRLSANKPGQLTFRLSYSRVQDATAFPTGPKELTIQGQIADLPMNDGGDTGLHMKFGGVMRGTNKGGSMQTNANSFFVENADEAVFYFTAATDYNFEKLDYDRSIDPIAKSKSILAKVDGLSFEDAKKRHVNDHQSMFDRVVFNMGSPVDLPTDERLDKVKEGEVDLSLISLYFQYGRYLLMGSSREPGVLPANLQGVWNQDMVAAWSSDFHTNINIQMNYWPAEVANLSETVIPFSNLISALREPGR